MNDPIHGAPDAARRHHAGPGGLQAEIAATLADASWLAEWLGDNLPSHLPQEIRDTLELGVAEVLSNIVRHGHGGDSPAARISLECRNDARAITVEVRDHGLPAPASCFETAAAPPGFGKDALEALPESGLGLALIRSAFDEIDYEPGSGVGSNRLRLRRHLR